MYFTAWATNSFTNSLAYQATADSYDSQGNVTNRVWKNPSGGIERIQSISWDALGRLHSIIDRDTNNSGYNWSAVYDALIAEYRQLPFWFQTASLRPRTAVPRFYFDPQVEFLELGVSTANQTVWKLYGPDLDGTYGGEMAPALGRCFAVP